MSAEEVNYEFNETPIRATVSSAQRATPAELIAIARQVWQRVSASKVARTDDAGNDALLKQLQQDFTDFSTSFPIVVRWMVQMRRFSTRAFEKFLQKHASAKLDTRESFLELQAEYLVLLFREDTPHVDVKRVGRFRAGQRQEAVDQRQRALGEQVQPAGEFLRGQRAANPGLKELDGALSRLEDLV